MAIKNKILRQEKEKDRVPPTLRVFCVLKKHSSNKKGPERILNFGVMADTAAAATFAKLFGKSLAPNCQKFKGAGTSADNVMPHNSLFQLAAVIILHIGTIHFVGGTFRSRTQHS